LEKLEAPVVDTARLTIRLVERRDLGDLFAVNGDEEVVRYNSFPAWKTPADGEAWLERELKKRESGEALQFVIVLRETGRVVGTMVLFKFDEPTGKSELGYSLARALWGRGLVSEAVAAFVEFAFENMGLRRLEASIDPRNGASAKVLTKAGFKHEGHQRRNYHAKGEISDTGLYGLLHDDPRPSRNKQQV